MFESLSDRLRQTVKSLRGQARLTEDNIKDALREVRMALLEADVSLPVIKVFIEQVKERAIGREVMGSLNPGQVLIKVVHEELTKVMGESNEDLNLRQQPPAIILMAGLQGAGKTTTTGKLAQFLKQKHHKKVMVVSADIYRLAAIAQLKILAEQVGAQFIDSDNTQKPVDIVKNAVQIAKKNVADVLIVDTAGRLHIDEAMMGEIKAIHHAINPIETLFVVDSMTGQDAVNTAKAFNDALPLTGVILTKTDGDARGGAALSIRHITGKPIKFLGVGEKTAALEAFHPERLASRILDMGDVLSLVEEMESKIDQDKAARLTDKFKKGGKFDLDDFRDQMEQMLSMGGMGAFLDKIPGMGAISPEMKAQANDKNVKHMIAIMNSMTPFERKNPDLIKASRRLRIAKGSGRDIQDVHRLLKQFDQMQKMMKKFNKGGMGKMMRAFQGMKGMGNKFPGM